MPNAELRFFWDSVKNHLTIKGLKDVYLFYPEFRREAHDLLEKKGFGTDKLAALIVKTSEKAHNRILRTLRQR